MPAPTLKTDRRLTLIFWAVTLIGGGIWLLLINFNLLERFEPTAQYVLAGVLAALGVGFFVAFVTQREKWWRLIPGWLLLTLTAMVLISTRGVVAHELGAEADGRLIASVLFWGLALAFLHVYLLRRSQYWWAIIPGGFMLVLGAVVAASLYITRLETLGALLSIGMGLVFVLLYLAARSQQGWWPLMPAAVLVLFGIAAYTAGSEAQNVLLNAWPILLILCGAYLARLAWPKSAEAETATRPEVRSVGERRADSPDARRGYAAAAQERAETEHDEREGVLGAYAGPAPGTTVEVLDDDPSDAEIDAPGGGSARRAGR